MTNGIAPGALFAVLRPRPRASERIKAFRVRFLMLLVESQADARPADGFVPRGLWQSRADRPFDLATTAFRCLPGVVPGDARGRAVP